MDRRPSRSLLEPARKTEFTEPVGALAAFAFDESKVKRDEGRFATKEGVGKGSEESQPDAKKAAPGSQLPQETQDRLAELGVSKLPEIGAKDIKVHDLAGDDVDIRALMTWRDKSGKLQHSYSRKFHEDNAARKWDRIKKLGPMMDDMRAELNEKVRSLTPGTPEHEGALIAAIIAETGLRPGNESSAKKGKYGISTLLPDHGKTGFGVARLDFVGKSGKRNTTVLETPELVEALGNYAKDARHGPIFSPGALAEARKATRDGVKLKDFRTIVASKVARRALVSGTPPPPPMPEKGGKKLVNSVIRNASRSVADRLNNTPAVARSSYIHPNIFKEWAQSAGVPAEMMA